MTIAAYLTLRILFAWLFFRPLIDVFKDFNAFVGATKLVIPIFSKCLTMIMVLIMIFGGLSILFGMYAQIAGIFLTPFCLLGYVVHRRLAGQLQTMQLSSSANTQDKDILNSAIGLGAMGHITSAQKNLVLAAVALFFLLMGSGPISVTGNVF